MKKEAKNQSEFEFKKSTLCKPFYTKVIRRIPLNIKKTLVHMDKGKYFELEKSLLEYCKELRSLMR